VLGTKVAVRVGNKAVVAAGLALWGADLLWMATNSASTHYLTLVGQMIIGGAGIGLITAPATEAILGAVPTEKAGVGSAVNDATRLFGDALGVAVIGSIAASLYSNRLNQTIPHGLPVQVAHTARGSLGGALVAAQHLGHSGLTIPAHHLTAAAVGAFLHSFTGGLQVAAVIAFAGAVIAAVLLPSRPGTPQDTLAPIGDEAPTDALTEPALDPIPEAAPLLDAEPVGACALCASNPAE
jgi:hypothetical protein